VDIKEQHGGGEKLVIFPGEITSFGSNYPGFKG
jgi:hypothetical protein